MPTIDQFEHGYDSAGVAQYLEDIKTQALDEAKEAVMKIDTLVTACEENWEGKARENFVANLEKDAQHCADQFDALYNVLVGEVNSLNAAMANKDEELINIV